MAIKNAELPLAATYIIGQDKVNMHFKCRLPQRAEPQDLIHFKRERNKEDTFTQ
jgi:hypothetical protein